MKLIINNFEKHHFYLISSIIIKCVFFFIMQINEFASRHYVECNNILFIYF